MRVAIVIAMLLALTGCNSGGTKAHQTDTKSSSRTQRCTERILDRVKRGAQVRKYIERTYCSPFAKKGWVYADGTLSIKAHFSLLRGYSCSSTSVGGKTKAEPCDLRAMLNPLDCAILHYVRKAEVHTYVRRLKRGHKVRCDDDTPLDKLGAS